MLNGVLGGSTIIVKADQMTLQVRKLAAMSDDSSWIFRTHLWGGRGGDHNQLLRAAL